MTKKVVHYSTTFPPQRWGNGAALYPVDHPDTYHVSNTRIAYTSPIVNWDEETGIIETMNTIYKPAPNELE